MYLVCTSQISMYSVRTEYRKHDKSTFFRLKVQTIRVTYQYVPVCTEYILVLLILVQTFLHFKRVHTRYTLTLVEYVLLVPDSIARLPGRPASLLASYSGTCPRIEQNHTRALAGLFTAAWQHPCQCLSAWRLAGGFSCSVSASPYSSPPWSAVCSPAAPAPASNAVCTVNGPGCVKDLGFHDEVQNIWAILQSSSSEILAER